MKRTVVIACFLYSGAEAAIERLRKKNNIVLDARYIKPYIEEDGEYKVNTKYGTEIMFYLKANIGYADYIFIPAPTEPALRNILKEAGIKYILLYPKFSAFNIWTHSVMTDLKSKVSVSMLSTIINNFNYWWALCDNDNTATRKFDLALIAGNDIFTVVDNIEYWKYHGFPVYEEISNEDYHKTHVISAFPASGKTYATEQLRKAGYKVLDSDSSSFSWVTRKRTPEEIEEEEERYRLKRRAIPVDRIKDEMITVRNPDFPNNYIEHIAENIGKADFIFVSSHEEVRKAMKERGIEYSLVYPTRSCRNEWVGRCYIRELEGNQGFATKLLVDNWDKWIDSCDKDFETDVYLLAKNTYLLNLIEDTFIKK